MQTAIAAMLERMIRQNPSRRDFQRKFEELIGAYNGGSKNIEELFDELVSLSRDLSEEQNRHVRENLTEDELTVLDILTRPGPELTEKERAEVKKVAHALLAKLKTLLTETWRLTQQSRARVRETIEETLDEGLPRAYSPDLFREKSSKLFEHVYERYVA